MAASAIRRLRATRYVNLMTTEVGELTRDPGASLLLVQVAPRLAPNWSPAPSHSRNKPSGMVSTPWPSPGFSPDAAELASPSNWPAAWPRACSIFHASAGGSGSRKPDNSRSTCLERVLERFGRNCRSLENVGGWRLTQPQAALHPAGRN